MPWSVKKIPKAMEHYEMEDTNPFNVKGIIFKGEIEQTILVDHSLKNSNFLPFESSVTESVGNNCFRVLPRDLLIQIENFENISCLNLVKNQVLYVYGRSAYKRKILTTVNRDFREKMKNPTNEFSPKSYEELEDKIMKRIQKWQIIDNIQVIFLKKKELNDQIAAMLKATGTVIDDKSPICFNKVKCSDEANQVFQLILSDIISVTPLMAKSISMKYTLVELIEEYKHSSVKIGEELLADISIVYPTLTRKVGTIISKRIYWHFSGFNGNETIA